MGKVATLRKRVVEQVDVLADIKDPLSFPWPYHTGSVKEITCIGVFEYIPGKLRGKFMDEVYRVLAAEGKATFAVPYWNSARSIQDYRVEWPPLSEQSFLYFNTGWREVNGLKTDLVCDFDFTYGYGVDAETQARSEESRPFYIKHYTNCVDALQLVLTKR